MRWDDLFADLEGQLEAAAAAELGAEVSDRTRRESALLAMVDRARGAEGHRVAVRVMGAGAVEGRLRAVGAEWLRLVEDGGPDVLVPLTAVLSLHGLGRRSEAPGSGGAVFARLGLASAIRVIARDRSPVSVCLVDGSVLTGTLDRVGGDFVELSTHGAGEARRRAEVSGVRTVPFAALGLVRG